MARNKHNQALSIATALGRVVLVVILLCPALGPLAVPSVQAQDVITAYYTEFTDTNTDAFQLNGGDSDDGDSWVPEVTTSDNPNRLRLTEANTNQFGTAWWQQRVTLADDRSFSAYFSFWIGDNSPTEQPSHDGGADGIVFAIQTESSGAGSPGDGLGYAGIAPSLGIEFDTHQNTAKDFDTERSHNHVGVDIDGDVESSVAVKDLHTTGDVYLQDGTVKHAWVDYDGSSHALEVRVSDSNSRPTDPDLTHEINLAAEIDPDVYVGFTAATGGLYSKHEICSFYFNNDLVDGGLDPGESYTQAPTRVEVSASPLSIDADGSTESTITATAYNVSDQPVNGASITFETDAGTLSSETGTTNTEGKATTTLTAATAGEATVRATAEGGVYSTTTVNLNNSAPTIEEGDTLEVEVDEDGALSDTSLLTANDGNPGDVVTWTLTSGPTHGTAEVDGSEQVGDDGQSSPTTLTYTPTADYHGDDSFDVQVSDGRATDEVTLDVTVHDAPEVSSITRGPSPGAETTNADTVTFDVTFSEAVSDVGTDDFSLHGTDTVTGTISAVSGGPAASYPVTVTNVSGDGTLRLDLVDDDSVTSDDSSTALGGEGTSGAADGGYTEGESYIIDNTPPTAKDDTTAEVGEDAESATLTGVNGSGKNVTDNDTDAAATDPVAEVEGDSQHVGSPIEVDAGGIFTVTADGSVTFNPDGDFESLAQRETAVTGVTVTIQDRVGLTDTAALSVTVTGANDEPTAVDDEASTNQDTVVTTGSVLENDQDVDDSDTLTVMHVATTTTTGAVADNGDGTFTYNPDGQFDHLALGESATDTFTYTISDEQGGSDTATVTVTINGRNDDPTGIALTHETITENRTAGTVVGTLSTDDVDSSDTHTYTLETTGDCEGRSPDNGSFAIDDNELKTKAPFDFEVQSAYTICVQTDDGAGGTYGKRFVIDVTDESVDLEIAKSVSDPTPAEDWTIRYTVTVTNAGPDRAKAVLITDTEPVSLTFQSSSTTHDSYDIESGLWDVGDLAETVSTTLVITAAVEPAAELDLITNTAVISSFDQQDADDADNAAERPIVVRGSRFELVKAVDDLTPREGEPFTYAITLTNRGFTSTAVVSDTLPPQTAYVSDRPSQGDYDEETGAWDVGEVGLNQVVTLTLTAQPRAGTGAPTLGSRTLVTNTATLLQSSRLDPEPADNRSKATVDIQQAEAVEADVRPNEGGELIVTATESTTTTVQVPAEAVTDSLTLIYTPLTTPTVPMPAGLQPANRLFDLTAYVNGVAQEAYTFTNPITVTIHYSDTDVAGLNEHTLVVYAWHGGAWRDAACGEGYDRHPDENWLTLEVCHLTDFGLMGQSAAVGGVTRPLSLPSMLLKSGAYLMTVVGTVGLAAIVDGGVSRRKRLRLVAGSTGACRVATPTGHAQGTGAATMACPRYPRAGDAYPIDPAPTKRSLAERLQSWDAPVGSPTPAPVACSFGPNGPKPSSDVRRSRKPFHRPLWMRRYTSPGAHICTVLSGAAGPMGQFSRRQDLAHASLFRARRSVRPTDDVHHRILKEPFRRQQPRAPPVVRATLLGLGFTEAAISGTVGFGRHVSREVNQAIHSHQPTIGAYPRQSSPMPVPRMSIARWSMAFLSLGHPLNASLKGSSPAVGSILVGASDRYQTRS